MLIELCVCPLIPDLDLATRVAIVTHRREWRKTTATAPLARLALRNCEVRVRGHRDHPFDARDLAVVEWQALLLFPGEDAALLTPERVAADSRPVLLVVPDGSWRQATRIARRDPVLAGLPRVRLPAGVPSRYRIRHQPRANGLCTLEAIARALRIIEGDRVGKDLELLLDAVVERTLASRGQIAVS